LRLKLKVTNSNQLITESLVSVLSAFHCKLLIKPRWVLKTVHRDNLSTLLVLALTQLQSGDPQKGTDLAKSIFVAIPSTLVFFIPFFLSTRLKIPFWISYGSGVGLLVGAFFIHRYLFSLLTK
jgi:hypothetical protein